MADKCRIRVCVCVCAGNRKEPKIGSHKSKHGREPDRFREIDKYVLLGTYSTSAMVSFTPWALVYAQARHDMFFLKLKQKQVFAAWCWFSS